MTIKDVAKHCGVSVSTVSRVLNGRPDVHREVRERVLRAVEELGYVPNNSARDLVSRQSDAIGVVVRGTGNLFFSAILKTVAAEIDRRGYTMAMRFIGPLDDEVKAGALLEREKKLRGLLFLGGRFDYSPAQMSSVNVPYVLVSYTNIFGTLGEESYSSVSIDDFRTAYLAVETLIRRGHRRIAAVVSSSSDRSVSELRTRGYRQALADNGIAFDPALLEETGGDFSMPGTYEGVRRVLARRQDFTALFTLSDTTGMAALKALEDAGKRVPQDVSVIAIDGIEVSEYSSPVLTTMVQPAEEMGRESVRILVDLLEKRGGAQHLLLETRLREGASVRSL